MARNISAHHGEVWREKESKQYHRVIRLCYIELERHRTTRTVPNKEGLYPVAFLEDGELQQAYFEAEQKALKYYEPFDEFERLAANKVRLDIPKNYPKVNDGSLASLLLETAMRVIPTMMTGKFTCLDRDDPWFVELVNILWRRVLVPGAESDAEFYIKLWNMGYWASVHGASAAFSYFTVRDGYRGADFSLPYIRDVYLEPGKVSDTSSNYIWLNSYFTKLDLKRIVENAGKEDELAKAENRNSNNHWDLKLLKAYVDAGPEGKSADNKNYIEHGKETDTPSLYKLATAFHRGAGAPFKTIIPAMGNKLVRTRKNENPTGDIPITLCYAIQDLRQPYGRGRVELSGATQNVLDLLTQADVLATQIGLEPPQKIEGSNITGLKKKSIVYAPRALWTLGSAKLSTVDTSTSMYTQLSERMGRYKGNLQNGLGASDASVSSQSGDTQFSKTSRGVNYQEERRNTHDNFLGNNVRSAFRRLAQNLANIHLANMQGQEVFTLLDDEVERLRKGGWDIPEGTRKGLLVYDNLRGKLKFEPDAPGKSSDPEKEALFEIIELATKTPNLVEQLRAAGYDFNLGEAVHMYIAKLQLEHPEKIIVPIEPAGGDGEGGEDGVSDDENPEALHAELTETMGTYGLNEDQAKAIMVARRNGYSEEDIAAYLTNVRGDVR